MRQVRPLVAFCTLRLFLTNYSDKLTPFMLRTMEWLAKHDKDDVRSIAGGIPQLDV
jgi:hypothetical protein